MDDKLQKRVLLADFSLLIVAFIWGGGFIAGKVALQSITPFYVLSFRFLLSGLIIGSIFFKKIKTVDKKTLISGLLLGCLLFVGQSLQTIGLNYTTAGKQSFLVATYTIFVPFISWYFNKKKPTIYSVISGLLTIIGIGFLSLQDTFNLSFGDTLTLLYAVVFAIQVVLIGLYVKDIDPISLTSIQLMVAGILSLISALLFEPNLNYFNTNTLLSIVYLILLNTTIAFLVQNTAQKYTSDTHASIIVSLQSLFGSLLSVLLLGEIFTKNMVIGCIFISIAVVMSKYGDKLFNVKHILSKFKNYIISYK